MATESPQQDVQWGSTRATRTKAMPKTTLFGSAMEIQTATQKEEVKIIDLAEVDKNVISKSKPKEVKISDVDALKMSGTNFHVFH